MHHYVSVTFRNLAPLRMDLNPDQPMDRDDARKWLDEQFLAMDCEPLRPTGKLLMTDRVVVVAQAAGPAKFADAQWAQNSARSASAVLGKPAIHVDADSLTINY